MQPIEMLMKEHGVIERMIRLTAREAEKIRYKNRVDVDFIHTAIDFIRNYADKCHHGKEEDILFRDALKKPLSVGHRGLLEELMSDHAFARRTVAGLESANNLYARGDHAAIADIEKGLNILAEFYPRHIEKEDKHFFPESMTYFSMQEQKDMIEAFVKRDQALIHDLYLKVVEKAEASASVSSVPS